jgi:DNA-binding IclR family transcriptional regulator
VVNPTTEDVEEGKDRQFVTALARGLEVLRCFTPDKPELGTSEIARATGIPQPTVWRLCYTLLQLGFLTTVPGRPTMRPGIALLGLGQAVLAGQPIAELAFPEMSAIASAHQGAVSLGARDGLSMIYLQRCHGAAIILANLRVGSRVPLGTSATGWGYIAGLSPDKREAVIGEIAASKPEGWERDEPRLRTALREFDQTGYVISLGSMHARINSVAVPVTSPDGSTTLALSSGGISDIFQPAKLAEVGAALKALAAKLSPLLGTIPAR